MGIRLFYEYTTDAQYEEITDRLRLYTFDVTQNAEEGTVALSKVTIDDPDGDYDIVGWRRMFFTESTATGSNQVIYNGYVADRTVKRGPYKNGAGRVWEVALSDSNVVGNWRVMTQANANRPAETDVARVQWLMNTDEMERIPLTDHLYTSTPVPMDAVDYRGQSAMDVLADCAQQSGKNYFVHTIDSGSGDVGLGIWYGHSALEVHSSPLRITTDPDEEDGDFTFAASMEDTSLNRDPSRTYSGVYLRWDGGTTYEEDTNTSNTFTRRDVVMPADNVKTQAKAGDRAQRYLSDLGTEEDVITTSILVPANRVNFVREGMRIPFKAEHLPGYEVYIWMRVLKRSVSQTESELHYRLKLELDRTGPVLEPDGGEPGGEEEDFLVGIMSGQIDNGEEEGISTELVELYPGATYLFICSVSHSHGGAAGTSNYLTLSARRDSVQAWTQLMGAERNLTAQYTYETTNVAGPIGEEGVPHPWTGKIRHTGYTGTNGWGSSFSISVYYVSGPDPRF